MATFAKRAALRWPLAYGCLSSLGLILIFVPAVSCAPPNAKPARQPVPLTVRSGFLPLEKTTIAIFQEAAPGVVRVTNLTQQSKEIGDQIQEVAQDVGSGFVWDREGHIVTNYHVVAGGNDAQVTLADHSAYRARDIWAYPDADIAVIGIKAPKEKLHPIPIGSSHDLKVGQIVFALGDPFGLEQTMTMGIVSALGREIESKTGQPIRDVIQTTAAMNPGNSGGPLLDSDGRLIGMNTAIVSPSGAFAGIGFAIPVDEIRRIVPELIRKSKLPHLGVSVAAARLAEKLGIREGTLILQVCQDTPAARAGLLGTRRETGGQIQLGDVIVAVGGKSVKSGTDLDAILERHKQGDSLQLTIVRAGERQNINVTLTQSAHRAGMH
jgi:S1-C subfamily serine protease